MSCLEETKLLPRYLFISRIVHHLLEAYQSLERLETEGPLFGSYLRNKIDWCLVRIDQNMIVKFQKIDQL